ncbi:MAG: hypothetical protein GY816_07075 [Cytophagales bacterium]|nr:hypothetical protein [Cytophagales bacterium]
MLSPESDPSIRLTRNTESSEEVLDKCFSIVEDFISKLWLGMKERYMHSLTYLQAQLHTVKHRLKVYFLCGSVFQLEGAV